MTAGMIALVWARVRRRESLFLALLERVRLGRFRGGWIRDSATGMPAGRGSLGLDRDRLPQRFGWLLEMMPYAAAGYGSQLSALLAEPDMAALVRDVPQARRILGPVCRMLGVELPGKRMVAEVALGVEARVGRTRVVRSYTAGDLARVALPRAVQMAAQRQGFGKPG